MKADYLQGIVQAFTDILTHGAPAARIVMLHIASMNPDSPSACYIHCTTGNNRSGVFIGVILSLLGVNPEKIAEEYSLSDIGLRPTRAAAVERLMKSPVFAGAGEGSRRRNLRRHAMGIDQRSRLCDRSRHRRRRHRLTMGGEPTFVSIDDMDGAEWNYRGAGPGKARARRAAAGPPAKALAPRRTAALRAGQMVSRRAAAALGA